MDKRINQYIGIPYREGGRDLTGTDCWGLAVLVLGEVYGIRLPSLTGEYSHDDREELERFVDTTKATVKAHVTESPEPGDLVVLKYRGRSTHIGVYVGDGLVLHNVGGTHTSRIERADSPGIARRIEGWYRVR
nr:tail assembly protein [Spirochaetaceae bacterium]